MPVGGALKTVAGVGGEFLFESHGEATQRRRGKISKKCEDRDLGRHPLRGEGWPEGHRAGAS